MNPQNANSTNHSPHQVAQVPSFPPAAHTLDIPSIPLELWEQIFLVLLHGAVEDNVALSEAGVLRHEPWYGHAFKSLWLTCRALYTIGEQVRRRLRVIWDPDPPNGSLDLTRVSKLRVGEAPTEAVLKGEYVTPLIPWLTGDAGWPLERLELVDMCLGFWIFRSIAQLDKLQRLEIRNCGSNKDLGPLPMYLWNTDVCDVIKVLPFKVAQLELNYTFWTLHGLPREVPFLAFLPTIETLALCGKSFSAVMQLPKTLSPPPLQHLTITDNQPYSVNKEDVISYFTRCSKLKTLDVDNSIQTSALAQGDIPANLPDLMEYKGPADFLTLLHTPNMRFALATGFDWDGGAWIRSLFTASPTLQGLVIELAARAEDPAWVEQAASRWSPHWRSTARFSLVFRTAPLGEWIFSAKVGRTDDGDLFIEYFSQR